MSHIHSNRREGKQYMLVDITKYEG